MSPPDREFTDEEVARILARATERHEASETVALTRGTGTSLEALEAVAREVGIDPEHVRAAALELSTDAAVASPTKFGVPDRIVVERTVPMGVGVARWSEMIGVLREEFGANGLLSDLGEIREWTSTNVAAPTSIRPVRVRVEPVGTETRITIEETTRHLRTMPVALGTTFTAIAIVFLVLNTVFGFVAPGVITMLLFAAMGLGFGVGGMKLGGMKAVARGEELEGIADRLELIARTEEETK